MQLTKYIVSVITLLSVCQALPLEAQVPRMVLLLSAEELRSDLIEELQDELSPDGIKRLTSSGKATYRLQHPLLTADATASEAILQTGSLAVHNGIPAKGVKATITNDGQRLYLHSVFEDQSYVATGTAERRSPLALTATTIGDQLKQATDGTAIVYSVAPNAEEALIGAGQLGDGAYWIDDFTGQWTTSTYYEESLPWYIDRLNQAGALTARKGTFAHAYKHSAQVNGDVAQVAQMLLENTLLGKDETPDLLVLHMYMGNPDGVTEQLSTQLRDAYLSLDRTVAQLLQLLDNQVGRGAYAFALTGNAMGKQFAPLQVAQRTFYPARTKSLINMYLIAKYGQENWVTDITPRGELFLNREAIAKQSKITQKEMEEEVATFLLEFSGVQYAIPNHQLTLHAIANEENRTWQTAINRSTHKERGDVIFGLLPTWTVEDPTRAYSEVPYQLLPLESPFLLYLPYTSGKEEIPTLDLRQVSKEISRILRIRPPTP